MGFATLSILIFHFGQVHSFYHVANLAFRVLALFFSSFGVDMFLFISGYGIYYSLLKNKPLEFYRRRLVRVLPTYIIIGGIFWIITDLIFKEGNFFLDFAMITFWTEGNRRFWYVSLSLILYLISPLIVPKSARDPYFIFLILISLVLPLPIKRLLPEIYKNTEIALCRIFPYMVGIYFGYLAKNDRAFPKIYLYLFTVLAGVLLVMDYYHHCPIPSRNVHSLLGIDVCLLMSCLKKGASANPIERFINFCGKHSLELYLSHVALIYFIRCYSSYKLINPIVYSIMIAMAFAISVPVHMAAELAANRLQK